VISKMRPSVSGGRQAHHDRCGWHLRRAGVALAVDSGARRDCRDALYGTGNGTGRPVGAAGSLVITGPLPTLTGATELSFEGAPMAIPPLVAGGPTPPLAPLTTWAQLAAWPFRGNTGPSASGASIHTRRRRASWRPRSSKR